MDLYILGVSLSQLKRYPEAADTFKQCASIPRAVQDRCKQREAEAQNWPPRSPLLLNNRTEAKTMTAEELEELGAILGHRFVHPERLEQALTHRSRRQNDAASDNERLEFLGDRVLGLIASKCSVMRSPTGSG